MNDRAAEKTMTVKEVADALGIDVSTINKRIREIYPKRVQRGVATLLNEAEATRLKMELQSNGHLGQLSQVASMPKTDLEKELIVQQALVYQQEKIKTLTDRLAIAEPKAEYHDRLVDAALATSFRDTAKELGVPERQFIETLIRKGYIYRDTRGSLKPYHNRMSYFTVKDWERDGAAGTQTRVTVAGKAHFLSLFGRVVADKPLFS